MVLGLVRFIKFILKRFSLLFPQIVRHIKNANVSVMHLSDADVSRFVCLSVCLFVPSH